MRVTFRRSAGILAAAGGLVALRPGTPANKFVREQLDRIGRRLQYVAGRVRGMSYRLTGRHPDPDVPDLVLADRIRSVLGPLEKRLDVPHVHVMVENHVVLLHGEVGTDSEAAQLEHAIAAVSGVRGVQSYLHVGLIRGDTRPSEGRAVEVASEGYRRLVDAAVAAGADPGSAAQVVKAAVATFADRIPVGEREQVAAHLAADVRAMFSPPRRAPATSRLRTEDDLVTRVRASSPTLPPDRARPVTEAVIAVLRSLVPDEAADVSAVLPADLRALWTGAPVAAPGGEAPEGATGGDGAW